MSARIILMFEKNAGKKESYESYNMLWIRISIPIHKCLQKIILEYSFSNLTLYEVFFLLFPKRKKLKVKVVSYLLIKIKNKVVSYSLNSTSENQIVNLTVHHQLYLNLDSPIDWCHFCMNCNRAILSLWQLRIIRS